MKALLNLSLLLVLLVPGGAALAKGDLATRATRLEPLVLGNDQSDFHMSVKEYKLETGKYYRWKIEASGKREYNLKANEFWRNAWIRQIAVGKMEIKTATLDELDFDDAGSLEVYFIPIRPGTYEFRLDGLEERGMKGKLVVE
jgi:uncharacterized cupredoxin-like copper-binding protein